ncbi:MAG: HEAT repeat domain-containing protein, partial [Nitrospirota bacterium]
DFSTLLATHSAYDEFGRCFYPPFKLIFAVNRIHPVEIAEELFKSSQPEERLRAIRELPSAFAFDALPLLMQAMEDNHAEIRKAALQKAANINIKRLLRNRELFEVLQKIVEREKDEDMREVAKGMCIQSGRY